MPTLLSGIYKIPFIPKILVGIFLWVTPIGFSECMLKVALEVMPMEQAADWAKRSRDASGIYEISFIPKILLQIFGLSSFYLDSLVVLACLLDIYLPLHLSIFVAFLLA